MAVCKGNGKDFHTNKHLHSCTGWNRCSLRPYLSPLQVIPFWYTWYSSFSSPREFISYAQAVALHIGHSCNSFVKSGFKVGIAERTNLLPKLKRKLIQYWNWFSPYARVLKLYKCFPSLCYLANIPQLSVPGFHFEGLSHKFEEALGQEAWNQVLHLKHPRIILVLKSGAQIENTFSRRYKKYSSFLQWTLFLLHFEHYSNWLTFWNKITGRN